MPYKLEHRGNQWVVVSKATGQPVADGKHGSKKQATAHLRALYANVKDAKK